jgi:hypothetical protein
MLVRRGSALFQRFHRRYGLRKGCDRRLYGSQVASFQNAEINVSSGYQLKRPPAIAPVLLLQAFFPLLEGSSAPKSLVLTSSIGIITSVEIFLPLPSLMGLVKVLRIYLVRKVAFENPKLTSMGFNPGGCRQIWGIVLRKVRTWRTRL